MSSSRTQDEIGEQRSSTTPQPDKGRERLEVSSGLALFIDQFMLSNSQFLSRMDDPSGDASARESRLREAAQMYGGCVIGLVNGTYRVFRDPAQNVIALRRGPENTQEDGDESAEAEEKEDFLDFEPILNAKGHISPSHHVFIDTRCLVFVDADFLLNKELVKEYQNLRSGGQDKQARDLLRSYGGAVRYGFNRYGDELGVFELEDEGIIALWPDVID